MAEIQSDGVTSFLQDVVPLHGESGWVAPFKLEGGKEERS
jgi:hypothetical protein